MIGELAGLGGSAAWAVVSTVMRSMANRINPIMVNGLNSTFGALTVAVLLVLLGHVGLLLATPLRSIALIVASGMIGQGVGNAFFVTSMKMIGASRAMPISSIQPLITTVLAAAILGERVTLLQIVGTFLVLCSVYLLAFPYGPLGQISTLLAGADRRGLLLALATAACWASATIMLREALVGVDLLSANFMRMTVAATMLLSFQAVTSKGRALQGADRRVLVTLALTGALGAASSLGYLTAVSLAGAAKASVLTSTSPMFGLPLSVLVLREKVNRRIVVGSLICVFGVWLVLLG